MQQFYGYKLREHTVFLKMTKKIITFILLSASLAIALGEDKVLMCYMMSWSVYRPGEGKFNVADIDPFMCTHIIYAYTSINSENHLQSLDVWSDFSPGEDNIGKLVKLKEKNPDLKILVSVGGWNEGSEKFSKLAKSQETRKTFIDSVMKYLRLHKLDGIDFDWQFPAQRGGSSEDKDNFATLLEELRNEFDKEGKILTARLLGRRYVVEAAYNIPRISSAVHYITMKSYEYHGTWEPRTGVYAPLLSQDENNVEFSVTYFLELGVPREKLLLGLSSGGSAFLMENTPNNGIYLGVTTAGSFKGAWVGQDGYIGFNELCWELTRSRLWTQQWDRVSSTPFAVHGRQFASFENEDSIEEKLELVKTKNLGGASLYSLDTDDFGGHCYKKKYPLTNKIKKVLLKPSEAKPTPSDNLAFQSVVNSEFPR